MRKAQIIALLIVLNKVFSINIVSEKFKEFDLQPDLVPVAPESKLIVKYQTVTIDLGTRMTRYAMMQKVALRPKVEWDSDPDRYYTLVMIDPDVPTRNQMDFLHWLVGNIPADNLVEGLGGDVMKGEEIVAYLGPVPTSTGGQHRFTFLLYQQTRLIHFTEPKVLDKQDLFARTYFSLTSLTKKYNLGFPVAGNFFIGDSGDVVIDQYT